MYKNRHKTNANNSEQGGPVFVDADDVPNSPVTEPIVSSPQLEELIGQSSTQQSDTAQPPTPTPVLRRSSRPYVTNRRYMKYLLLIDRGEPECYDEAC